MGMEKEDNKTADVVLDWSEMTFVLGEKPLLVWTEEHYFLPVPDVTQVRVSTVLTSFRLIPSSWKVSDIVHTKY
ncbi:hypothetical protein E2C01_057235 [Portunus trituberculatus]|uniref:Uncharacterized protein n=1 Tax=Portunus trituberculatus TaxID=210409 RepID=A0A5B7GSF3_PORTR|nr:hypothetical protein [Portunus trituberculatus]